MGINIHEAWRERGEEIKEMIQERVHPHECVHYRWGWGVSETEKMEERETACPHDSGLETQDVPATEAEVGDLLIQGRIELSPPSLACLLISPVLTFETPHTPTHPTHPLFPPPSNPLLPEQ